jgi:hypothetical protein
MNFVYLASMEVPTYPWSDIIKWKIPEIKFISCKIAHSPEKCDEILCHHPPSCLRHRSSILQEPPAAAT